MDSSGSEENSLFLQDFNRMGETQPEKSKEVLYKEMKLAFVNGQHIFKKLEVEHQ